MSDPAPSQLDLLVAGLLSHGFQEDLPVGEWRCFIRHGREDRWLRESDLCIIQGDGLHAKLNDLAGAPSWLFMPLKDSKGQINSYHQLLMKCGGIYIKTRKAFPPTAKQRVLPLPDADDMLEELKR